MFWIWTKYTGAGRLVILDLDRLQGGVLDLDRLQMGGCSSEFGQTIGGGFVGV